MDTLYVAFGSNLNRAAMKRRCPGAKPLGRILLDKSRLVFRGVADLEYDPQSQTPCGVWLINEKHEEALDRYEGVDSGMYYKDYSIRLRYKGKPRSALVYLMRSQGVYPPCQTYVDTIRQGYADFKLDPTYLDEAISHSFNEKDPRKQERTRRKRQRNLKVTRELVSMPESVALKRLGLLSGG